MQKLHSQFAALHQVECAVRQTFELPIPPSANHRLGMQGQKFFRTQEYKDFIRLAGYQLMSQRIVSYPIGTKLGIKITVIPDSLRRRDIDSYCKCTFDFLQEKGIIADDFQFWHMQVDRSDKAKVAKLVVEIWELEVK